VPILAPYKLASTEVKPEPSIIKVGEASMGGKRIGVIAGPCTVESRQQTLEIARAVKEAGAIALRGGAFKPRTSPYSFQGLMEEGLEFLALTREETGLAIVSEVLSPEHVKLVDKYVDVFQIGTRNMTNFLLLKAVGETRKPVLLKRGMSATMEEFLLAGEYILSQGNPNVILCERGIRTFETHTRFTLALSIVPSLKEVTHLPVIVDPSHGTGKRSLVAPMSKAAIAAGADGLLIEVHPEPDRAWVDGQQTLTLEEFARLMKELRPVARAVGREL
jgi:3-deoxy-7-phosphoheptulonate synthase